MSKEFKNLLFSFLLVIIAAALSSYFTRWGISNWYEQFEKPLSIPDGKVFSTAWGLIYIFLTLSYWRILNRPSALSVPAGRLFLLQLLLQVVWCILFFYQGMLAASFAVMLWLIYTVIRMIRVFSKIDTTAGALNYFYLLYICYAAFFNFAFLYVNGYVVKF